MGPWRPKGRLKGRILPAKLPLRICEWMWSEGLGLERGGEITSEIREKIVDKSKDCVFCMLFF